MRVVKVVEHGSAVLALTLAQEQSSRGMGQRKEQLSAEPFSHLCLSAGIHKKEDIKRVSSKYRTEPKQGVSTVHLMLNTT